MKRLERLISVLPKFGLFGSDVSVKDIVDDSRKVQEHSLFVAIKGERFDGHTVILGAIQKGAVAVVGEEDLGRKCPVTYVRVPNSREALGHLASAWYDCPSIKMKCVGVTGTDGKTTTANLIYWVLKKSGKKAGLISTVGAKIGDKMYDTGFHVTNPEPLDLQKFLQMMVINGCEYAVLEVTSHGLDQDRVAGIKFDVSVLTNVTHEHLDYHKTFDNYCKAKAKLFLHSKMAILNEDNDSFEVIGKLLPKSIKRVGYSVSKLGKQLKGVVQRRFPESYNRQNAAAAICVASSLGIADGLIAQAIVTFPGVEGRMQEVHNAKGFRIYIDFAHTPNALENVLKSLHGRVGEKNRLICVFGCAGERDLGKRPMMGRISRQYADISIITAEDPRGESVDEILRQIKKGAESIRNDHELLAIADRGEAISYAIQRVAKKGDMVIICGKGHEKSMAYNGVEYEWSDHEAVEEALVGKVKRIKLN